ncbi:hypothetical protein B0H19DRAFT_1079653 [Mycena capillaripes]|nr:hypothetical protein B0H19DRAFT_1079653 [Mycena capillaripes]
MLQLRNQGALLSNENSIEAHPDFASQVLRMGFVSLLLIPRRRFSLELPRLVFEAEQSELHCGSLNFAGTQAILRDRDDDGGTERASDGEDTTNNTNHNPLQCGGLDGHPRINDPGGRSERRSDRPVSVVWDLSVILGCKNSGRSFWMPETDRRGRLERAKAQIKYGWERGSEKSIRRDGKHEQSDTRDLFNIRSMQYSRPFRSVPQLEPGNPGWGENVRTTS